MGENGRIANLIERGQRLAGVQPGLVMEAVAMYFASKRALGNPVRASFDLNEYITELKSAGVNRGVKAYAQFFSGLEKNVARAVDREIRRIETDFESGISGCARYIEIERDYRQLVRRRDSLLAEQPIRRRELKDVEMQMIALSRAMTFERAEHPEYESFLEYKKVRELAEQYEAGKPMLTERREAIVEKTRALILKSSGVARILLVGPRSAGKNTVADWVSYFLTGTKAYQSVEEEAWNEDDKRRILVCDVDGYKSEAQLETVYRRLKSIRLREGSAIVLTARDISKLPNSLKKDLDGMIEVPGYDRGEIFDMFRACLMNEDGLIVAPESELVVPWIEVWNGGDRSEVIEYKTNAGGVVWRLTNLVYQLQATEEARPIDFAMVFQTLKNYSEQATSLGSGLNETINDLLCNWASKVDQSTVRARVMTRLRRQYNLDDEQLKGKDGFDQLPSALEIGEYSYSRPPQKDKLVGSKMAETIRIANKLFTIESKTVGVVPLNELFEVRLGAMTDFYLLKGVVEKDGQPFAFLVSDNGKDAILIDPIVLETYYADKHDIETSEEYGPKSILWICGDFEKTGPEGDHGLSLTDESTGRKLSLRCAVRVRRPSRIERIKTMDKIYAEINDL